MKRVPIAPRDGWQQKVASAGLVFHSPEGEGMDRPYWDESACYEFTAAEIDTLEAAGNTLQQMCLEAAQHVIDKKRYAELAIPPEAIPAIQWAWNSEPPAIYGRFDVAYDGSGPPKLLEYNADTPTSLLEAAVIQWSWLEEQFPNDDQFNSIHEKLIAKWQDVAPYLSKPVYFAGLDNAEDQLTLAYLRDTADQAGLPTLSIWMEEIGWNADRQAFVDPDERQMFSVFKLYPWEMMVAEEFGPSLLDTYQSMRWIEPIWKMLLSNKGLLPILWELYPNHDLLLEAHFEGRTAHCATTSASLSTPARAPTSPSSATAPPSPPPAAPTLAPPSSRPSPPSPASPTTSNPVPPATPSSASGWSTRSAAASESASPPASSRTT